MRHGDVTLCESKAIATYIDRVFDGPKVIPEDPARAAQVEQWVSLGNVEFDKLMIRQYVVGYVFPKEPGKPDMAAIGAAAEKMKPQVAVLDRAVAGTGYLAGDSFTLADINILPMLFYVNRFEEGKALLGAAKNLSAYMERHFARPSFRKSAPAAPPRKRCTALPRERSERLGRGQGLSAARRPTPPPRFAGEGK